MRLLNILNRYFPGGKDTHSFSSRAVEIGFAETCCLGEKTATHEASIRVEVVVEGVGPHVRMSANQVESI
jgi:hypothetical protein